MNETDNLNVVREAYAALDSDDVPAFLSLCTHDVQWIYPTNRKLRYGGSRRGLGGVEDFLEAHDSEEEILEFEASEMIAHADRVLVLGHYSGKAKTSGRDWETDFVHLLIVRDGKIARFQAYFDTAAAVDARS